MNCLRMTTTNHVHQYINLIDLLTFGEIQLQSIFVLKHYNNSGSGIIKLFLDPTYLVKDRNKDSYNYVTPALEIMKSQSA